MPNFPASKDTWTPKIDRDLTIPVTGDRIVKGWYNDWKIWIEAFQDTMGYNILGGYGTLVERLDDVPSESDAFVYSLLGGL